MNDFVESLPYTDMEPHNELVGNGKICFAQPGVRYVCFCTEIKVDLSAARGSLRAKWVNPPRGFYGGKIAGGGKETFLCPDDKDWLLHLLSKFAKCF